MTRKILFAVGGTGGHIYPAQSTAKRLLEKDPETQILFAGFGLDDNRFLDRKSFRFQDIPSANFAKKDFRSICKSSLALARGFMQSLALCKSFAPHIVVGFGSFHSLPILLAARFLGIPIILHEANSFPGRVNRFFAKAAEAIAVQFEEAKNHLDGSCIDVAMPLREGYTLAFGSKMKALRYFRLTEDKFTLLVFGGSQGALTLNALFSTMAIELIEKSRNFQIIHLTGDDTSSEEIRKLYRDLQITAYVKGFEKDMEKAWLAADMVICRAGASSIAEQIEFEVPGILIPYPYASDEHQYRNARYMEEAVGGCVSIKEKDLDSEKLCQLVLKLLSNDQIRLKEMRKCIKKHKDSMQKREFSSIVSEVAGLSIR